MGRPRKSHRVVIAFAIAAVLIAATEIGLRVLTDRDSAWNIRLGTALRFDPVTYFRWKPNQRIAEGIVTNEHGLLARPGLPHEKPSDALRIVYLGDSVTVLPAPGFYPAQVESQLAERGIRVETLNAAVPGYSSESARALFETEISQYDGDYFFVYLGWNDLGKYGPEGLPYKRRAMGYQLNPVQSMLTHVYSLRLLYAAQDFWRHSRPSIDAPMSAADERLYAEYHPQHYEDNLRAILALAKARYPNVFVMNLATITSPSPTESELRRAHYPTGMDKNMRKLDRLVGTYNAVVAKVAAVERVDVIDLHALFDTEAARRNFTDSCHVDRDGAARIATAVREHILQRQAARAGPS